METVRKHRSEAGEPKTDEERAALARLRDRIDRIDQEIVTALADRYRLAEEVGTLKDSVGLPALDPEREARIVRAVSVAARSAGIPEEGVRRIFWSVVDYCRQGACRPGRAG